MYEALVAMALVMVLIASGPGLLHSLQTPRVRTIGAGALHQAHFDSTVRPSRPQRRAMSPRLKAFSMLNDESGAITVAEFLPGSWLRSGTQVMFDGDGGGGGGGGSTAVLDLNDKRQEATKLKADARTILDTAQEEKRDLTADEETKFDRLMEESDKIDGYIEREEKLRAKERHLETPPEPIDKRTSPGDDSPEDEAMRAFRKWARDGLGSLSESESRALTMANDPEGGYLVAPQEFVKQLLKAVDDEVDIRRLATVQTLTESESLGVPTLDTDLADADWTAELSTGSQDDNLRFGKRELRPNPLAKRVLISRTLLRRGSMNPEEIVRDRLAYKFAVTAEKAYMTGDGNKKPLGLFTANSQGISTARDVSVGATGAIPLTPASADQLIDAKYTLKAKYHKNAQWLFHRLTVAIVRKLKNSDGDYIWHPGLATDRPDTILDLPFLMNEFVPSTVGNNTYIGMLGDFSFYWIADALDMEVQRLVELYAETNQVGFIGRLESDGMPMLEEPFVRLKVPS